jgi:hypothetical protein
MTKPTVSKTHFEQVPLELVKKIAVEKTPDVETTGAGATVKVPVKK